MEDGSGDQKLAYQRMRSPQPGTASGAGVLPVGPGAHGVGDHVGHVRLLMHRVEEVAQRT